MGDIVKSIELVTGSLGTGDTSDSVALTYSQTIADCVVFDLQWTMGTTGDWSPLLLKASFSGSNILVERAKTGPAINWQAIVVEFNTTNVNVYTGEVTIDQHNTYVTGNIGATVDMSKSFLLFSWMGGTTHLGIPRETGSYGTLMGKLNSTTQVAFKVTLALTNPDSTVRWFVVECVNTEWTVYRATDSNPGTLWFYSQAIGASYDRSRSMILGSNSVDSNEVDELNSFTWILDGNVIGDNVSWERTVTDTDETELVSCEVVEFSEASGVQVFYGEETYGDTGSSISFDLGTSTILGNRTLNFQKRSTWPRVNCWGTSVDPDEYKSAALGRLTFDDESTGRFVSHQDWGSTWDIKLAWQLILWDTNTTESAADGSKAGDSASALVTIPIKIGNQVAIRLDPDKFTPTTDEDLNLCSPHSFVITINGSVLKYTEPVFLSGNNVKYTWERKGDSGYFVYRQSLPLPEVRL